MVLKILCTGVMIITVQIPIHLLHAILFLFSDGGPVTGDGTNFQPEFAEPLENLTVAIGRDATFTCIVKGLGGYRVIEYYLIFTKIM